MKKLPVVSLSVLVSLFVCGTTLNVSAREVVKTDRQACAMLEPFSEVELPDRSVHPSVPIVPVLEDGEKGLAHGGCTVFAIKECEEVYVWVATYAKECSDALKNLAEIVDKLKCPEDIPELHGV